MAAQVAPVLVHLARTNDVQHLTVHLHPVELGPVSVHVERAASGPARVELSVARADTLELLRSDGAALNRALDAAGVPAEGRQVSFSLDTSNPPQAGQAGAGAFGTALSGDGGAGAGGGFSGGGFSGSGSFSGGGGPSPRFLSIPLPTRAGLARFAVDLLA